MIEGSVDGAVWSTLLTVLSTDGSVGNGMDTFVDLGFLPASLSFVRVSATGGDGLYSVGELTLAAAVPEPSTWALGLSGLLMPGAMARRRGRAA